MKIRQAQRLRAFSAQTTSQQQQQQQQQQTDANGLPLLTQPGHVRLFASYTPSLVAGTYNIDVQQAVSVPGQQTNTIKNTNPNTPGDAASVPQSFSVQAPRFSLGAGEVHSTYPPSGHADSPQVLPHVVLNDPHLPWERALPGAVEDGVNVVPWLAVLVFDPGELQIDSADSASILGLGAGVAPLAQAKTMEVALTLDQLLSRPDVALPLDPTETLDKTTATKAIFVKPGLFATLHDPPAGTDPLISLDRYKYLAHVRNVNGSGGAIASLGDENGLYGIVVSHRTGPLTDTVPRNVVVHLVSLDGIREHVKVDMTTKYVALISLYSWQYQCLPPSVDLPDQLRYLGTDGLGMLRPPNWNKAADPALAARLSNGYSLVRHRTSTGESTVAFMRGPLSPVPVPYPLLANRAGAASDAGAWPAEAFNSDGYQILDAQLGIMDISYAAAWQLGRAMAMADRTFSNALVNLRAEAHTKALAAAKAGYLRTKASYSSRMDVTASLSALVKAFGDKTNLNYLALHAQERFTPTSGVHAQLSLGSLGVPEIKSLYSKYLARIMHQPASAALDPTSDDFDIRTSANWPIILNWLLDRMNIANVPAYYLINHPDNVPKEAIRFFHIDLNWIAAQIDGALSLGNHSSRPPDNPVPTAEDGLADEVRHGIKVAFAQFLASSDPAAICPNGGFFMRSAVVKAFPDLIISSSAADTVQIISTAGLAEDTLLTLMRRQVSSSNPGPAPQGAAIIIQQPPHQQRFVLGTRLDGDSLTFSYTEVYTVDKAAPPRRWKAAGEEENFHQIPQPGDAAMPIYDWSSRLINVPSLAQNIQTVLVEKMTRAEYDVTTVCSAAVVALQLNDKLYQLFFYEPASPQEWAYVSYGSSLINPSTAATSSAPAAPVESATPTALAAPSGSPTPPAPAPAPAPAPTPTDMPIIFILEPGDLPLTAAPIPPPHTAPAIRLPTRSVSMIPPASTLSPQIALTAFANFDPPPPPSAPLPNNQPNYLDIVFSLQPSANTPGLQIESLAVRLPIGGGTVGSTPLFTQKYDGPGAVMLGNCRFQPVLSSATDAASGQCYLVVTLTPRTLSGVVPFASSSSFSFLLREVAIDTSTAGEVPITLVETYSGTAAVQSTVGVAKGPRSS